MAKPEKLFLTGIVEKQGWRTFIDWDGAPARIRERDLTNGGANIERLKGPRVRREPLRYYFIDDDGDISWMPEHRKHTLLGNVENPLDVVHGCTTFFEPVDKNSFWLLIPGRDAPGSFVGTGRVLTHRTDRAPDSWLPGDRLFWWQSRPRRAAIGELMLTSAEDGGASFNVAWFSDLVVPDRKTVAEIEPAASAAASRGSGDRLVRLTPEQGRRLAVLLETSLPRVRECWRDVFDAPLPTPAAEERHAVYEKCWYHILSGTTLDKLAASEAATIGVKGTKWKKCHELLVAARARGQKLLALFEDARYFRHPEHAAIITDIVFTQREGPNAEARVSFASFQRLERRYLFSKLRLESSRAPLSPDYQRDAVALITPRLFRERGLPISRRQAPAGLRPAASPPDSVGRPYVAVGEVSPVAASEPFSVDPNVVDRGKQAHASTQDRLAEVLRAHGLEPRSPQSGEPDFDLAWSSGATVYVVEVKSLTRANEEQQLRLGLGQVLRYRQQLARPGRKIVGVVAAEREPRDSTWAQTCCAVDVRLVWPATFESVVRLGQR